MNLKIYTNILDTITRQFSTLPLTLVTIHSDSRGPIPSNQHSNTEKVHLYKNSDQQLYSSHCLHRYVSFFFLCFTRQRRSIMQRISSFAAPDCIFTSGEAQAASLTSQRCPTVTSHGGLTPQSTTLKKACLSFSSGNTIYASTLLPENNDTTA